MTPQPSPQLVTLCLDAVRLAKCLPAPKWRRPRPELCPSGYLCGRHHCGSPALIHDDGDFYCSSCSLDAFDARDLPNTEAFVGAALDSFSRWAERTYDEMTDREYCGGACLNCQERAAGKAAE